MNEIDKEKLKKEVTAEVLKEVKKIQMDKFMKQRKINKRRISNYIVNLILLENFILEIKAYWEEEGSYLAPSLKSSLTKTVNEITRQVNEIGYPVGNEDLWRTGRELSYIIDSNNSKVMKESVTDTTPDTSLVDLDIPALIVKMTVATDIGIKSLQRNLAEVQKMFPDISIKKIESSLRLYKEFNEKLVEDSYTIRENREILKQA